MNSIVKASNARREFQVDVSNGYHRSSFDLACCSPSRRSITSLEEAKDSIHRIGRSDFSISNADTFVDQYIVTSEAVFPRELDSSKADLIQINGQPSVIVRKSFDLHGNTIYETNYNTIIEDVESKIAAEALLESIIQYLDQLEVQRRAEKEAQEAMNLQNVGVTEDMLIPNEHKKVGASSGSGSRWWPFKK